MQDLRWMLNEWDFIGVREFCAHDDEYDCLLGPLLTRLASGAGVDEVATFLHDEIESHFGLNSSDIDVAGFAVKRWPGGRAHGCGDRGNDPTSYLLGGDARLILVALVAVVATPPRAGAAGRTRLRHGVPAALA
jgi:hypothetical protein